MKIKPKYLAWWVGGVLFTGLMLYLLRRPPAESGYFPPCPVHHFTGLHCPGCGSLRGISALLNGDIATAWSMNPLMVLSIPILLYGGLSFTLKTFRGRGLPYPKGRPALSWGLLAVIILFTILRNIPGWEFLAP